MNSNWSYSPETVKLGVDLCDLDLWPLTLTFCMDVTFVIGNLKISWWYDDGNIVKKAWQTDGQTDRQTDWTIHRAAWSQLKTLQKWWIHTLQTYQPLGMNLMEWDHTPVHIQIFGHQRAQNDARNTKMNSRQETHPIRVISRYEMNWADNFIKKFQKSQFRPNIWSPEGQKWG